MWGDLKNLGISRKKKSGKLRKTKTYNFWKFPGMSTSKCCREVNFEYFWVRFSGIEKETCQKANYVIKWKFKKKFRENWKNQKLLFFKISRNVNFKMLYRGEFWVFLSAPFGNRYRNMSTSPQKFWWEYFMEKIQKKVVDFQGNVWKILEKY